MAAIEPSQAYHAILTQEIAEVEQTIRAALVELRSPFLQLVLGQLEHLFPLVRGAVVLAAGQPLPDTAVNEAQLRSQRINLAAAIEMLRLALDVHARLLPAGSVEGEADRSILGSTILAGDYCFSRSAGLAARTNSPEVVDLFAQALQRVSEGYLRRVFDSTGALQADNFAIDRELILSGIRAAYALHAEAGIARGADLVAGAGLADALATGQKWEVAKAGVGAERLPVWQALAEWIAGVDGRSG